MMWRSIWFPAVLLVSVGLWVFTRLGPWSPGGPDETPGQRLLPLGGGSYHAEAVFEEGGLLRIFTLGADATRPADAEAEPLAAYVSDGGASRSVILEPVPQPGDSPGKATQFVGRVPDEFIGRSVGVSIPTIRVGGERFRIAFASAVPHGPPMPEKTLGDEERELFLTPGGKYTPEDIRANGRSTPSQVFVGFRANHDHNPKSGERICPVTRTKADPRCAWTVNGESHWFCCPPCIDEFVRLAKERPEELAPAESYRVP